MRQWRFQQESTRYNWFLSHTRSCNARLNAFLEDNTKYGYNFKGERWIKIGKRVKMEYLLQPLSLLLRIG